MREVQGDIWDYYNKGFWIVITTNGTIKANGDAVMGRGVALEASRRFGNLRSWLGFQLSRRGNNCYPYSTQVTIDDKAVECGLITFPVKHNWQERADLALIEKSCRELAYLADTLQFTITGAKFSAERPIYMVRPGCGNGRLNWKDVKPILEYYLDDRFVVVEKE